ncbi:MAG: endonuclease/exonuclease/phosphatase family protein [Myxococcales bacterium]|nr:endonuclease/exonuclease/phosphatase family protein [Myxococcales bacterium]
MKLPATLPRPLVGLAQLALLGAATAALLGLVGGLLLDVWIADLLNHFVGQYLVIAAVASALVGLTRRWRWLALGIAVVLVDLALVAPLYLRPDVGAPVSAERLRVLQLNVLSSNHAYEEVKDYLARSDADVIFVQEVSATWAAALGDVAGYRVVEALARHDNFGIAALVRDDRPKPHVEVLELVPELPALALAVELDGAAIALLSVHTLPPGSADYARRRDRMLAAAGVWADERRGAGEIPVIVGDLNTTPFSRSLRHLLDDADLVNSQAGHGLAPTWPTGPWFARVLFAIPIDHLLHDRRLITTAREVGPELGSDHRPLRVELGLRH